MALIVVAAADNASGATTVAVGLAHRLAYAGRGVRLERLAGDERAAADAALFGTLEFATSSGEPREPSDVAQLDAEVTLVEAPAGADAAATASAVGGALVLVAGDGVDGADGLAAPDRTTVIVDHARRGGPLAIPEDRLLAAPTVGRLIEASGARVIARSLEGDAGLCEHIVVGAIAEDSDQPHFERFARKAVVTRAEKVDIALAALRTDTRCLILTGGAEPSPYLLDRVAAGRGTTLLVAPHGTVETVRDIEGAFGSSPFSGAEKIERIGELTAAAVDDAALEALLSGS